MILNFNGSWFEVLLTDLEQQEQDDGVNFYTNATNDNGLLSNYFRSTGDSTDIFGKNYTRSYVHKNVIDSVKASKPFLKGDTIGNLFSFLPNAFDNDNIKQELITCNSINGLADSLFYNGFFFDAKGFIRNNKPNNTLKSDNEFTIESKDIRILLDNKAENIPNLKSIFDFGDSKLSFQKDFTVNYPRGDRFFTIINYKIFLRNYTSE